MQERKLNKFVVFVPGINPSRAENQFGMGKVTYYDQAAFESDFNHEDGFDTELSKPTSHKEFALNEGDVVISNSLQLATIVGKRNAGKVSSLNFTKVEFLNDKLDKRYFLYLLNGYKGVRRQKERELQGTGAVLRIPLKALSQIIIPVVPIEEQKKIGMIYSETLKLQSKLNKYGSLLEQFTCSILEEALKEE